MSRLFRTISHYVHHYYQPYQLYSGGWIAYFIQPMGLEVCGGGYVVSKTWAGLWLKMLRADVELCWMEIKMRLFSTYCRYFGSRDQRVRVAQMRGEDWCERTGFNF
jgi:hypothetical protein